MILLFYTVHDFRLSGHERHIILAAFVYTESSCLAVSFGPQAVPSVTSWR